VNRACASSAPQAPAPAVHALRVAYRGTAQCVCMLVGLALAHSAGSGLRPMRLGRAAVSALASSYGGETAPTFDNEWEHEMAGAEKLAKHVPAWAAEIMLDEAAGAEYEAEQARARAEAHVLVEGREWGDGGGAGGDGGDGEAFGSGAFTPAEIGDDYGAPLEAVLAKLLDLGVPERDLRPERPLSEACTAAQVASLVHYLQGCDPIELREGLADESIGELASELGVPHEAVLELARRLKLRPLLGAATLLPRNELALLRNECVRGAR